MKEDYLWDKTGSDPEIENLENALRAFRYSEISAPELPAEVIPFKNKKEFPRKKNRFALAAAACLAILTVAAGVWFQISNDKTSGNQELARVTSPESSAESTHVEPVIDETLETKDLIAAQPVDSVVKRVSHSKQFARRKSTKTHKAASVPQAVAGRTRNKKTEPKLTEEEQYAYNQLMLALSITGSKLKLVKDKIEGME